MNIVALIPARAGSKRIPGKNIKLLGGKPLMKLTIEAARESRVFSHVYVSSDDDMIRRMAEAFGASAINRPTSYGDDSSPDILWVKHALNWIGDADAFSILRPTSPFRTAETIRRARAVFQANQPADSLRAIRVAKEHPGKMWRVSGARLQPLYPFDRENVPWHSCPTQTLPVVFTQTASLEIAWTKTVTEQASISGASILPFTVEGWEGFDINTPEDWDRAERHVADLQTHPAAQ